MSTAGHQELELMQRTLHNLAFIERHRDAQLRQETFEITQLVNSFLGVVAHPWEKLFDTVALATLKIGSEEYVRYGFPQIASSWDKDTEAPDHLAHLLRLLRNGIAHGNIDLLDKFHLRIKFHKKPETDVRDDEIAGAEIWNNRHEKVSKTWPEQIGQKHYREPYRTWGTVLTIDEMRASLDALYALAQKPEYVRASTLERNGGRQTQERSKSLITKQIQRDRPA